MKKRLGYGKARGILVTRLLARDGPNCALCGEPLDRKLEDDRADAYVTLDHIIPRSRGGLDEPWNLQLAHQKCNAARGDSWRY